MSACRWCVSLTHTTVRPKYNAVSSSLLRTCVSMISMASLTFIGSRRSDHPLGDLSDATRNCSATSSQDAESFSLGLSREARLHTSRKSWPNLSRSKNSLQAIECSGVHRVFTGRFLRRSKTMPSSSRSFGVRFEDISEYAVPSATPSLLHALAATELRVIGISGSFSFMLRATSQITASLYCKKIDDTLSSTSSCACGTASGISVGA